MWNFQRIICIWICCVSCMFGTTQLSSLVQAVPYEYFDEHEQSFYDLDSEQIQAKYDARLLTQQMLQTEQQQQQLQQHLENLKGFHQTSHTEIGASGTRNKLDIRKPNDDDFAYAIQSKSQSSSTSTKLKNNDDHTSTSGDAEADERNDWLEEMVTMATDSTSAVTDPLDELHLPRAASCFTNGQKYTHGQKVPRLDNCEVCLCMDGEIFCWWEKCDKKSTKASTTYDDYSTPFEESSTTRIQLNPKTTYKTTLKPMKKPKINIEKDYKYDDDDSAEILDMQHERQQELGGIKEQLRRKEQQKQQEQEQHKIHHNKQMVKKKIYQQQEEEKHNKKIKEQNKKKQEEQLKQQRHKQQQQQHKIKEHFEQQQQHHHGHNHNNNNHDYGSSGSNSKILNFPENLPSVLYYDYKTEEHHQHQHQHREQHLKHQKQKQQQQKLLLQQHEHEKEIKQQQQEHHVNHHHHEYGQDFNTYNSLSNNRLAGGVEPDADSTTSGDKTKLHNGFIGPSTTFKYFNNGNEKIYNSDLLTDSDILPEPPTKKPKFSTSITDITETAKTTATPMAQFYRTSSTTSATGATRKQTTTSLTNTPPTAPIPLKKIIFSPWDRDKAKDNNSNNKDTNNEHNISSNNKNNNESTEDIIDTDDDQDDAFHRWLTSTETNNKNNFTLSDSNTALDMVDGGHVAAGSASGTGNNDLVDASKSDYNVEDRNYENFDWEAEMGFVKATLKPTEARIKEPTTTTNTLNIPSRGGEKEGTATIYDDLETNGMSENAEKLNYEQKFTNNNMEDGNGIINIKGNGNNISPFNSSNYQNYNQNNYLDRQPATSSSRLGNDISSTNSNEDNNVASVVNIDIMLTASSADTQVQQQQQPKQTNVVAFNQHSRQLQDFEQDKETTKAQLTSNSNAFDNNKPLYSIINDNTKPNNNRNSNYNYNKTISNIAEQRVQLKANMGVDLSSRTNINSSNTSHSLSSSKNSLSSNQISTLMSEANSTSIPPTGAAATTERASAAPTPSLTTTLSPERQCNVMGTLYKIGDVLPQDTGNCLQCICIDGSTSDDTPRVTCSPHNCPPLVLPDLFDATGY